MSATNASATDQSAQRRSHCCGNWAAKGNWSGLNITAMVLGFVFFWPIGLLVLYWIIKGRSVQDLPQAARRQWSKVTGSGDFTRGDSENTVFSEYQQTQYDRIREIKDEIKERSRRFAAFRADAKRRADEEEFNRFMSEAPGSNDG